MYGPSLLLLPCICILYRTTVYCIHYILYYSTTHYSIQQSSRTQYLRPFDARRMSSIPLSTTLRPNNFKVVFALGPILGYAGGPKSSPQIEWCRIKIVGHTHKNWNTTSKKLWPNCVLFWLLSLTTELIFFLVFSSIEHSKSTLSFLILRIPYKTFIISI